MGETWNSFPTGQELIFDKVDLNIGGHYSSKTGQFTCPHNGPYFISITVYTSLYADIVVWLEPKNVAVFYFSMMVGVGDIVGNRGVFYCDKGNTVSVRSRRLNSTVYGARDRPYTTMSVTSMHQTGKFILKNY